MLGGGLGDDAVAEVEDVGAALGGGEEEGGFGLEGRAAGDEGGGVEVALGGGVGWDGVLHEGEVGASVEGDGVDAGGGCVFAEEAAGEAGEAR